MKKHETDPVSLGFGLAFLVFAGWCQLVASVDVDLPDFGWFVAGGLILFGLLGIFGSVRSHGSRPPDVGAESYRAPERPGPA